jgi:hypothetical protein
MSAMYILTWSCDSGQLLRCGKDTRELVVNILQHRELVFIEEK